MVIGDNQTSHGDYFVKLRNIKSLCCTPGTNIVLQVKTQTNSQKKRLYLWLPEARDWGGALDVGDQNVETLF